jgi:hypothetical protein
MALERNFEVMSYNFDSRRENILVHILHRNVTRNFTIINLQFLLIFFMLTEAHNGIKLHKNF